MIWLVFSASLCFSCLAHTIALPLSFWQTVSITSNPSSLLKPFLLISNTTAPSLLLLWCHQSSPTSSLIPLTPSEGLYWVALCATECSTITWTFYRLPDVTDHSAASVLGGQTPAEWYHQRQLGSDFPTSLWGCFVTALESCDGLNAVMKQRTEGKNVTCQRCWTVADKRPLPHHTHTSQTLIFPAINFGADSLIHHIRGNSESLGINNLSLYSFMHKTDTHTHN